MRILSKFLTILLLFSLSPAPVTAEIAIPNRTVETEGTNPLSWDNSQTVFVGPRAYNWWNHKAPPTSWYNSSTGSSLVLRADHPGVTFDLSADTVTLANVSPYGCLPVDTEVQFTTTGVIPGGITSWETDRSKVYYTRDCSGSTLKLAEHPGGAAIDLDAGIAGSGVHGMSFGGHTHTMGFNAAKAKYRIVCDPSTNICTTTDSAGTPVAHGLSAANTSSMWITTSGTLPAPMVQMDNSRHVAWCTTYISTTTVYLRGPRPNPDTACTATYPTATPLDITTAGTGVHLVYRATAPNVYVNTVGNYPAGSLLTWRTLRSLDDGITTSLGVDASAHAITMLAKVPATTAAGSRTVTVTFSESSSSLLNPRAIDFTLRMVLLTPMVKNPPTTIPALTYLTTASPFAASANYWYERNWYDSSNGGGAASSPYPRCPNRSSPTTPLGTTNGQPYNIGFDGVDANVWFYHHDIYKRMGTMPKQDGTPADPDWLNCAVYVAKGIRDRFIQGGPQTVENYYYFPWPMVFGYSITRDPSYKSQVLNITYNGKFTGGSTLDFATREHSWMFERRLATYALTGVWDPYFEHFASNLIGMLYINAINDPARTFKETFITSFAARTLLKWYALSGDERVPYVVKLVMDDIYAHAWNPTTGKTVYNVEPDGMRCGTSCTLEIISILNMYTAPLYWWHWAATGDATSLSRGDEIFNHLYHSQAPFSGKEFAQTTYWVSALDWRLGTRPYNYVP